MLIDLRPIYLAEVVEPFACLAQISDIVSIHVPDLLKKYVIVDIGHHSFQNIKFSNKVFSYDIDGKCGDGITTYICSYKQSAQIDKGNSLCYNELLVVSLQNRYLDALELSHDDQYDREVGQIICKILRISPRFRRARCIDRLSSVKGLCFIQSIQSLHTLEYKLAITASCLI